MIDDVILLKARAELGRLNQQLHDLHLEEQRCQLKRGRLEADKARIQSFVDTAELALRFQTQPSTASGVSFVPVFEDQPNGPKFVVPGNPGRKAEPEPDEDEPAPPLQGRRSGLTAHVTALLRENPKGMSSRQMVDILRERNAPVTTDHSRLAAPARRRHRRPQRRPLPAGRRPRRQRRREVTRRTEFHFRGKSSRQN